MHGLERFNLNIKRYAQQLANFYLLYQKITSYQQHESKALSRRNVESRKKAENFSDK